MDSVRFDVMELSPPQRRSDGTLRLDARLTRTGVFKYIDSDGKTVREYRPPEEVFKKDSIASLQLVPVTDDHPLNGTCSVSAENARRFSVGCIGQDVRRDANFIRGTIAVNDVSTIEKMYSGKNQLSCGYKCIVKKISGVSPEGEHYDAIQTNIAYNHVAIVDAGRAGASVIARMDSEQIRNDDVMVQECACDNVEHNDSTDGNCATINITEPPKERNGDKTMKFTFKVDGVDHALEGEPSAQQALEKHKADSLSLKLELEKSLQEATDKAAAMQARADSAEADLAKEKQARLDSAACFPEMVKARVKLEREAAKIIEEVRSDASDVEIMREVAAKSHPDLILEDKADAYIKALFDIAVSNQEKTDSKSADAEGKRRELAGVASDVTSKADKADPLAAYNERMRNMASRPLKAMFDSTTNSVKVGA